VSTCGSKLVLRELSKWKYFNEFKSISQGQLLEILVFKNSMGILKIGLVLYNFRAWSIVNSTIVLPWRFWRWKIEAFKRKFKAEPIMKVIIMKKLKEEIEIIQSQM
jgi:hypothetical protein